MILVKTAVPVGCEDEDSLVKGKWSYKIMKEYEMTHRAYEGLDTSHHITKKYVDEYEN
jgi:hypothetical protein